MVARPTAEVLLTLDARSEERREWRALAEEEKRLAVARERADASKRGGFTRKINALRPRLDELAAVIESGQLKVTVEGLGRGAYRALLKAHPPTDDPVDQRVGYAMDTFGAALLKAATIDARTLTGAQVPLDVDTWVDDDQGVTAGEFERWFRTALNLSAQPSDTSPPRRAS